MAFLIVFGSSCILTMILVCSPLGAFWNTLAGFLPGAGNHCIHVHLFFMVSGSVNTILDFILLVLVCAIREASYNVLWLTTFS